MYGVLYDQGVFLSCSIILQLQYVKYILTVLSEYISRDLLAMYMYHNLINNS